MKNSFFKYGFILIIILLLISCVKTEYGNKLKKAPEKPEELSIKKEELKLIIFGLTENEHKPNYHNDSLVYKIRIPNKIDIRKLPSDDSVIIDTLPENSIIDIAGAEETPGGYYLAVIWGEEGYGNKSYGWIKSDDINIIECYYTEINIKNVKINSYGHYELSAFYIIDDEEKNFSVYAEKQEGALYSFFWDFSKDNFHYSNKPGLYAWNENTNELKHISYKTSDVYNSRHMIINDLKFLLLYGDPKISDTNFLSIWNLESCDIISKFMFFEDFKLRDNTIEIIKYYDSFFNGEWAGHDGQDNLEFGIKLSDEEKEYAKRYMETNEIPKDLLHDLETGYGAKNIILIIIVEHDIETNIEIIIGAKYIMYYG